jgi:hypothetical protein
MDGAKTFRKRKQTVKRRIWGVKFLTCGGNKTLLKIPSASKDRLECEVSETDEVD